MLLTGGLTIYLWNKDGTVKPHADVLFGLKEASIPLILGIAVIGSHRTASPLLRVFLYSDSLFDIPKIETRVAESHRARRAMSAFCSKPPCCSPPRFFSAR